MGYIYRINRRLVLVVMVALLSFMVLPDVTPAKAADSRGSGSRDSRTSRPNNRGSSGRAPQVSRPDVRSSGSRVFIDSRFNHDRSYPTRGQVIRVLPRDHRVIVHGGSRFFFSAGVWYRPYGATFIITAPPFGLFVPILPPFYTTIWVGGIPYYYANDVYYAHRGTGYVVVEPPPGEPSQTPPPADQMFIYPRMGQTEQQQADDRYACHKWAVSQSDFDPTQPPGTQKPERRADYQRAMAACLDGRGYTVK